MEYRYKLEPYKGRNTRHICPNCEKREFVRYIDESGRYVADNVGRCNRESNCGYHYTPKQYFDVHCIEQESGFVPRQIPQLKPTSYISQKIFTASLKHYENNNLIRFLYERFPAVVITKLIEKYYIGTTSHWLGSTVFWQVDKYGRVRTGKIIDYNASTGKRVKKPYSHITWVHSALKLPDFNLRQCLFGEHLLLGNNRTIGLVESEKTAVICSIFLPDLIWLATGSKTELKPEKLLSLKGRRVILNPDLDGFYLWKEKIPELSKIARVTISPYLNDIATEVDRLQGLDLADYLLRTDYKETHHEQVER
jgi:hypothetical protein